MPKILIGYFLLLLCFSCKQQNNAHPIRLSYVPELCPISAELTELQAFRFKQANADTLMLRAPDLMLSLWKYECDLALFCSLPNDGLIDSLRQFGFTCDTLARLPSGLGCTSFNSSSPSFLICLSRNQHPHANLWRSFLLSNEVACVLEKANFVPRKYCNREWIVAPDA